MNEDNIFHAETEFTAAGLRFVENHKKKQTLAQVYIRAYGSLANKFAEKAKKLAEKSEPSDETEETTASVGLSKLGGVGSSLKSNAGGLASKFGKKEQPKEQPTVYKPKVRRLWIPLVATWVFTSYNNPNDNSRPYYELAYEFDLIGKFPYGPLIDPLVPINAKYACVVGIIIENLTKVPFSGDLAAFITEQMLNVAFPEYS